MNVTVFVPIQMTIKHGSDERSNVDKVHEQLHLINRVLAMSELESYPDLNVELVGDAEIVEDN